MTDQFTVEEQRAIARTVSELVQPLELKIMVLGRVALFYRCICLAWYSVSWASSMGTFTYPPCLGI